MLKPSSANYCIDYRLVFVVLSYLAKYWSHRAFFILTINLSLGSGFLSSGRHRSNFRAIYATPSRKRKTRKTSDASNQYVKPLKVVKLTFPGNKDFFIIRLVEPYCSCILKTMMRSGGGHGGGVPRERGPLGRGAIRGSALQYKLILNFYY